MHSQNKYLLDRQYYKPTQIFVYFPDYINLPEIACDPSKQSAVYAKAYLNNLQTNGF